MPVSVRNQAFRKREKHRAKLPQTIDDVNISSYADLTTTKNGKPFYRGKTASGSEVFMTDDQIEIAGQTDTIFVDGTFWICPHPFFQVFIISAKVGQNVFPMATP